MKPISSCTADQLLKHINNTIKDGNPEDWYIIIDEHNTTIELIDPETHKMHGILACEICYKSE